MDLLIAVLAGIVALEYGVIALAVVPRLARLATTRGPLIQLARWGAAAFFLGCAVTHTMIAVAALRSGADGMGAMTAMTGLRQQGPHGQQGQLWEDVLAHLAQVVGGAAFIGVAQRRLVLSVMTKDEARELRELARHLGTAFDEAPVAVALVSVDDLAGPPVGRIVKANPALCRLVGRPAADLVGQEFRRLLVHPDDQADSAQALRDLVAQPCAPGANTAAEHELRFVHRDGHEIWVQVTARRTHDAAGHPRDCVVQVRDITGDRRRDAQLRHQADHDALTGLFNRHRFGQELDRVIAVVQRQDAPAALLVVDLDHFKYVNDTYGHATGDELLSTVARVLSTRLRVTDVVGRLGGDEFAVALPDTDDAGAKVLAEALLTGLREEAHVTVLGRRVQAGGSIGITMIVKKPVPTTAEQLLAQADIAMYEAKETGRDRVVSADGAAHGTALMRARLTWSQRIRDALDDGGFTLWEQPIRNLSTGCDDRSELLLRMLDPDTGSVIEPAHFLPVAERFGQIHAIDRWVFSRAIDLLELRHEAGDTRSLEINLSGASLTDETLIDDMSRRLRAASFDARRLIVEVTETVAVGNVDLARVLATRLADVGCRFALDDFGSGFGSFFYLKHLPFDGVKVDGDFVKDLPHSHVDLLTLEAIISISHGLHKEVTAEFVQNQETLTLLQQRGVAFAQGYFIGRPAPVPELAAASSTP